LIKRLKINPLKPAKFENFSTLITHKNPGSSALKGIYDEV